MAVTTGVQLASQPEFPSSSSQAYFSRSWNKRASPSRAHLERAKSKLGPSPARAGSCPPLDAPRGSYIAQFLLDGDASGPLKKTPQDLEKYNPSGVEFCLKIAHRYSDQLFEIYQKEDPYFP